MINRGLRTVVILLALLLPSLPQLATSADAASLAIGLYPSRCFGPFSAACGPVGTTVTISGSGAPPGSTVWTFWRPWASGQPCTPFTSGGFAVSGQDVGADGRFTAISRTQPVTDGYPTVQGIRYMAAVGTADALSGSAPVAGAVVSNVACFTFNPPAPVRYFPQTGFVVANGFLAYWEHFGGLSVFGYPIS